MTEDVEIRSIGGVGPVETDCFQRRWLIRRASHEWGKWFHRASDKPNEYVRLCKRCSWVDYGEAK